MSGRPELAIKICGITNLDDALAAVDAGATALGFNFYPRSPRYLTPAAAAAIAARVPGHILKAGIFVDEPADRVAAAVSESGMDVAQLHGAETPADFPAGIRIWKAFKVDDRFDLGSLAAWPVEAVLLDSSAGGSGQTFDWRRAVDAPRPIVLAGGLDASNVAEAIRIARPWGVDSCSRLESAPGRKDHHRVRAFIEQARAAWQLLETV